MPILTMSHLSFSINVPVRHIELNEKQFYCYSSFKICPILPKLGSDDLQTELHRNDWTEFFERLVKKKKKKKKKLFCCKVKVDPKLFQRLYLDQSLINRQNFVRFINTMNWEYMPKLGTAPPMGREILKMQIFGYNFWTVSQQIIILELRIFAKGGNSATYGSWLGMSIFNNFHNRSSFKLTIN